MRVSAVMAVVVAVALCVEPHGYRPWQSPHFSFLQGISYRWRQSPYRRVYLSSEFGEVEIRGHVARDVVGGVGASTANFALVQDGFTGLFSDPALDGVAGFGKVAEAAPNVVLPMYYTGTATTAAAASSSASATSSSSSSSSSSLLQPVGLAIGLHSSPRDGFVVFGDLQPLTWDPLVEGPVGWGAIRGQTATYSIEGASLLVEGAAVSSNVTISMDSGVRCLYLPEPVYVAVRDARAGREAAGKPAGQVVVAVGAAELPVAASACLRVGPSAEAVLGTDFLVDKLLIVDLAGRQVGLGNLRGRLVPREAPGLTVMPLIPSSTGAFFLETKIGTQRVNLVVDTTLSSQIVVGVKAEMGLTHIVVISVLLAALAGGVAYLVFRFKHLFLRYAALGSAGTGVPMTDMAELDEPLPPHVPAHVLLRSGARARGGGTRGDNNDGDLQSQSLSAQSSLGIRIGSASGGGGGGGAAGSGGPTG